MATADPPQTYSLTNLLSGVGNTVSYEVSAITVDNHCRGAYPVRDNLEPLIDSFSYNPKQTACALGGFGAYRAITVAAYAGVNAQEGFNAETFCDLSMGGFLNGAVPGASPAVFSITPQTAPDTAGVFGAFGLNVDLINADHKEFTWTDGADVSISAGEVTAAVEFTATGSPHGVFAGAGLNTMGELLVDSFVDDAELEAACQEGFETFRHWACSAISGATYPSHPSGSLGGRMPQNQERVVQAILCQDGSNTGTGGYNFGSNMKKAGKKKGKKASGSSSSTAGFAAVGVGSAVVTAVGMKLLTGKKNAAPKAKPIIV